MGMHHCCLNSEIYSSFISENFVLIIKYRYKFCSQGTVVALKRAVGFNNWDIHSFVGERVRQERLVV
jgi:hypothetical protein